MAALLNDDELDPTTATSSAPPDTSTSAGGSQTQGTGSLSSPTPNAPPAVNSQTANQDDTKAITSLNQNVDFSPLINYVGNQGTQASKAINDANTGFTSALGSGLGTFGQPQQDTLNSVIRGQSPLSTGQSLLNNTYGGPSGFDPSSYTPLVNQYQTSAGELGNTAGIDTLLQQMNPALSQGELNFDALNYSQNPAYKVASQGIMNDANVVGNNGANAQTNALAAIAQRQKDINAYNLAGTGYVSGQNDALSQALNNQILQAGSVDRATQDEMNAILQGADIGGYGTQNLTFDPNLYHAQNIASLVGGDFTPQTVNPYQYLSYNAGQLPTRSNVASQDQASQYNVIEQLLNEFGTLQSQPRTAATLGLNNSAFQQALLQAQQRRDQSDAAWLAAHQPVAPTKEEAPQPDNGGGGGGMEGGGGNTGGGDAGGDGSSGGGSSDSGGSGGDSFFKGGMVKAPKSSLAYGNPKKNNLAQLQPPAGIMPPAQQQALLAAQGQTTAPSTAVTQVPTGYQKGGYIPVGTGNPRVKDDIPANVDDGEFVVNRKSVNAVGPKTMAAINNISKLPPAHQHALTRSLHAALSKAISR